MATLIHCIILSLQVFTCVLSDILWQSFHNSSDNAGWSQTEGNSATYSSFNNYCPYGNTCWEICSACCFSLHIYTRESFSTVGYTNLALTFDINTKGISSNDYEKYCRLEWSSNSWSTNHVITEWDDGNIAQSSFKSAFSLIGAQNQPIFQIRVSVGADWAPSTCCYFSRFIFEADPMPTQSTSDPSTNPTSTPTVNPTLTPTKLPSISPTKYPTNNPSVNPTVATENPSVSPTKNTKIPSNSPTKDPTISPTTFPTKTPSSNPTKIPSVRPTIDPTPAQGVAGEETTQNVLDSQDVNNQDLERSGKANTKIMILVSVAVLLILILCILCCRIYVKKQKSKETKIEKWTKEHMEMEMTATTADSNNMKLQQVNSTSNVIPTVSPTPDDGMQHSFVETLRDDVMNAVKGETDYGSNAVNGVMHEVDCSDDEEILDDSNTYKTSGGPVGNDVNSVNEGINELELIDDVVVTSDQHQDEEFVIENDEEFVVENDEEFVVENDEEFVVETVE